MQGLENNKKLFGTLTIKQSAMIEDPDFPGVKGYFVDPKV